MASFAPWQAATRCTGSAGPGSRALMKFILDAHPKARSLGIYACRSVRGGSTTSCHGEGRALDVGFPMTNGRGSKAGHALVADILAAGPRKLGVQAVIYDRTIWSARSPKGRRYTGVNPHYDHVHIELTRGAAAKLTLATVRQLLGGKAPVEDWTTYTVRVGDNLEKIAAKHHTTVAKLVAKNGLKNPDLIGVGLKLRVPK